VSDAPITIRTLKEARRALAKVLVGYENDPLGFILWAFPWGTPGTELEHEGGPDEWQRDVLTMLGSDLGEDPWATVREATSSGHGIGKSTLVAWLVIWAFFTMADTRGTVTANTDTQLRTKTWPEVSKWFHMLHPVMRSLAKLTATALHSAEAGKERNWRIDAIPWSESNPAAFAGLHNAGKRVLIIMDEASEIADVIWDTIEGATTDNDTQILWYAFANPTSPTGRFKEVVGGKFRHLWRSRKVDSRNVKRTNKALIDQWIQAWGEDSDFVRVRVRGEFPRVGSTQLISSELIDQAQRREVGYIASDALVCGLDVARYGDDQSVLRSRRGRDGRVYPPKKWRGVDTMTLAGDVALWCQEHKPDALFVDVGGVGAGVYDRLLQLNVRNVFPVNFGAAGGLVEFNRVSVRTANKRASMWCMMREWLVQGGAIDDDADLKTDLENVQYGFDTNNAILLEKKEHMKARGVASPDDGDGLALTFAEPVMPRRVADVTGLQPAHAVTSTWDIHGDLR
jgi:hypothetical protein